MAFNSFLFIALFLPAAVIIYYLVSFWGPKSARLPALILLTSGFYAYAAWHWFGLLLTSIVVNYLIATQITRHPPKTARWWLWLGVTLDVAALVGFKYTSAAVANLDQIAHLAIPVPQLVLPLAISFYSFQQISFLVDLSRGRMPLPRALDYASYVLFFPYILAGPIALATEMVPQLKEPPHRKDVWANLFAGSALFALGLFKKTVIADTMPQWVDPVYAQIGHHAGFGAGVGGMAAWGAAAAYLFQIYFDFSGYSDMALGCGRMLGMKLPLNFHAPMRSPTVLEYWRRWHITLGRFVQTYIFQPMAVPLTRWCIDRDFGNRLTFTISTLVPLWISMVILGVWHGTSFTFALFGMLHGSYMVVNEIWARIHKKKRRKNPPTRAWNVFSIGLTTVAVIIGLVLFRAPDVATAGHMLAAMSMLNGEPPLAGPNFDLAPMYLALVLCFTIVYLMPTSQQIMTRVEPALEWPRFQKIDRPLVSFTWSPTLAWSVILGLIFAVGFIFIARAAPAFVYFGF